MTGDILYLQTFDGNEFFVPDDEVKFLTYGNFGAPDVNFITRRGYRQHGATEVDYILQPRTISVELWHSAACTRQQYWDNRLALHEFLRHNRGGPITFILRQPGGKKRALVVRADPGLKFPMPGTTDNNSWNVDEPVDFTAFDPIWFDPDDHVSYLASAYQQNLVFPITFPIIFGSANVVSSQTITYLGTWISYPTLRVYGPFTAVVIRNIEANRNIFLSVAVAGGDYRTIILTPGAQRVMDAHGNNRFGDLGAASDLVNFGIYPDPEIAGGLQTITADFVGGMAGATALQIDYQDRFFAI